jgi:glycosyltransferase involved in cell wall biosynthesis
MCPGLPLAVVANGVDIDYFSSSRENPEAETIVFTGSMAHPPNNEAALHFCRNIFPGILAVRPNVRFTIVGSSPSREVMALDNGGNIKVTGFVEDTRPYLDSAAVVVVPLLSGSGTRLKIMEAMAMSKAIISTSIGAEGIEYSAGEDILIADEDSDFAEQVVTLLANQNRRTLLGQSARKLVESKYSWPNLAKQLENVYSAAVAKRTVSYEQNNMSHNEEDM